MPVSPVYTLLASQVPAVQVPAALPSSSDGSGPISVPITAGETTGGLTKVNQALDRLDMTALYGGGGGAHAIYSGLDLSDLGALTARLSAGRASIQGIVEKAQEDKAAADNATAYWWLSQAGTVTPSATTTPPAGAQLYLGQLTTAAGIFTKIDRSGVMEIRGGFLWRKTADAGVPTDTPPASVRFFHQTTSSLYWWDGTQYLRVWEPLALQARTIGSGEKLVIPVTHQAVVSEITVSGTGELDVLGVLHVL